MIVGVDEESDFLCLVVSFFGGGANLRDENCCLGHSCGHSSQGLERVLKLPKYLPSKLPT